MEKEQKEQKENVNFSLLLSREYNRDLNLTNKLQKLEHASLQVNIVPHENLLFDFKKAYAEAKGAKPLYLIWDTKMEHGLDFFKKKECVMIPSWNKTRFDVSQFVPLTEEIKRFKSYKC